MMKDISLDILSGKIVSAAPTHLKVDELLKRSNEYQRISKKSRIELIGILKGKVWMADDFNVPLEELKEYME